MRFLARSARFVLSWRGALVLVGLAAVGLLGAWYLKPDDRATQDWTRHYDVSVARPELIPAGTVIGDGPPAGWSRLVVKSKPKLAPGERAKLSSLTAKEAELLLAAMVADVQPEPGAARHRLRAVAIGMGATVRGADMILSPDAVGPLDTGLDLIDREVLSESYKRQDNSKLLVQAPAFALLDAPVPFRCGDRHRMVAFRYALVVDEPTGRLDVLVWWVDPQGQCEPTGPTVAHLLPENLLNQPLLHVDTREINFLGVPTTDTAFAVAKLPPAAAVHPLGAELAALAARSRFTHDDARRLEEGLRALLQSPPAPNP